MMRVFFNRLDVRISLAYFMAAGLWIVTSDTLVARLLAGDPVLLELISIFKGLGFVLVTTVVLYIIMSTELRKRTRIEETLQQEHDISPVGIAIFTPTGAIRYANAQAERILGLTRSTIAQQPYKEPLWHITDYDGKPFLNDRLPFAQVMQTRQAVYGIQYAIEWPDGKRVLLEINAAPLFTVNGTIREVVTTFNDVTVAYQNVKLLRESENHYRLLVEQAADGIFVANQQGHYVQVNQRGCEMLGYTLDEMLKLRMSDLVPAEDLNTNPFQFEALKAGKIVTAERRLRCKDGSLVTVEISARMLPDGRMQGIVHDLIQRNHAEAYIRYQANLIENISDAIISTDPDFMIRSWNKAAESLYGWAAHEVIGKSTNDVLPTTYTQDTREAVLAHFRSEGLWKGEVIQPHRDGTPIQILASISLTYDSAGMPLGAVAINRDISNRKRAEKALRASEERLRLFIEYAPASLAMFDTNMHYQSVSRRWLADYRIGEHDIINQSHYEIFPEISDRWKEVHQRGLAGEVVTVDEDHFVRKDGTVQWLRWEVRPWYTDDGIIGGIVIFTEDISERKQAQTALDASEKRFRTLIEKSTDVIVLYSADRRILYTSPSVRTILGYAFEEMTPKQRSEFIHPDDVSVAMGMLSLVLEHPDETITNEVRLRHQDGSWRYFKNTARNLLHDPAVAAIVVNANDITAEKRAAEAIAKLNQRLTFLRQIDKDIIAAQSAKTIVDAVVKNILQFMPCHSAMVLLFDEAISEMTILATISEDTSIDQPTIQFSLLSNSFLEVLKGGKNLIITDSQKVTAPVSELATQLIREGIRSILYSPLMVQGQLIGSLGVTSKTPDFFTSNHEEIIQEVANQLAIALLSARLREAIQTKNQQLQTLSAQMVEAQEVERRHIARELHDEIGQTLTALSLMLDIQMYQGGTGQQPADMQEAKSLVSDLIRRIRELSLDLRPAMLDDLGLIPTLGWYFKRYEQQTSITIDFKYGDVERRFPTVIETTLYRIIQEALTNVARHAQVGHVTVRLWLTSEAIHIQIEDTGTGFDVATVVSANKTGGILGLRERAQLVSGTCVIESQPGEGTSIMVNLPFTE